MKKSDRSLLRIKQNIQLKMRKQERAHFLEKRGKCILKLSNKHRTKSRKRTAT